MRLAKFRILYGLRWYQQAPSILTQLVSAEDFDDDSWLAAVRHDLRWLSRFAPLLIPVPPESTADVFQWFHDHQHDGARKVRRAIGRAICTATARGPRVAATLSLSTMRPDVLYSSSVAGSPVEETWTDLPGASICVLYYVFGLQSVLLDRTAFTAAFEGDPGSGQWLLSLDCAASCSSWRADECSSWSWSTIRFQRLPTCVVSGPHHENILPLWQQRQEQRMADLRAQWRRHGFPPSLDPAVCQVVKGVLNRITGQLVCQDQVSTDWMEVWIRALAEAVPDFRDDSVTWAFFEWGRLTWLNKSRWPS